MTLFATKGKTEISTEAFAQKLFSTLGVTFEERESSHYEEGGYFRGFHNDVEFSVYKTDRYDLEDMPLKMPLTISIECDKPSGNAEIESAVDYLIRSKLMPEGFSFQRFENGAWVRFT